jgi:hypothetical protein
LYGIFDPILFSIDVATQDISTIGEVANISMGFQTVSNYTEPFHEVFGAKDATFCNNADGGTVETS